MKTKEILNGRYEILDVAGEGGMADIYTANDLINNRKVAIKRLKVENIKEIDTNLKRFYQEAILNSSIHPSEHLTKIYDMFSDGDIECIVMDYVPGKTLRKLIKERVKIYYGEALSIISQICLGLKVIHEAKIVHRDIKPENIMITVEGVVKIIDFGIAWKQGDDHITRDGNLVGTPQYLAPEAILNSKNVDFRVDIFSLGIILFEMIAGVTPFANSKDMYDLFGRLVEKPIPSVKNYSPNVPEAADAIISKCTAKDRNNRYNSLDELIEDLNTQMNLIVSSKDVEEKENFLGDIQKTTIQLSEQKKIAKFKVPRKWRKRFREHEEKTLPAYSKKNNLIFFCFLALCLIAALVVFLMMKSK